MGTRLIARGVAPSEVWRAPLDHPELVAAIHRSYATADAITAASFGLSMHADHPDVPAIARSALKLARDAAGERPVIASLGPGDVGRIVPLLGDADVLLLETFTRLDALREALRQTFHGLRWATLCFLGERTLDGATPEDARDLDADAVGVNCGAGLESGRLALRMLGDTSVIARPSAGVESQCTPEEFAKLTHELWSAGVAMVGGCCGVHAEHIAAAVDELATSR